MSSERLTSSQFLKHSWIKDASLTKNLIDMKRLQEHLQHRTQVLLCALSLLIISFVIAMINLILQSQSIQSSG